MSSTETLTFGPEWLRALSGGSSTTSPSTSPAMPSTTVKFKLAQYRYGREEMLALFEQQNEIHPELLEAPNLISETSLLPMSLIPLTEEDQRAFSGGVNSDKFSRSRGGSGMSSRGRSFPSRGRGRGRGEGYTRSISQIEDSSAPPYSRGASRDYSRRESWDDRSYSRGGRGAFEDGPSRKPIRRSDASEDWRSDANRASGDGADADDLGPDWRPPAPSRRDSWRDSGRTSGNWRDSNRDWSNEGSYRRPINRSRSLSSKYDQGDSGLMPEWADDADDAEVGVFDASGAFQTKKSVNAPNNSNSALNNHRQSSVSQPPLKRIEERDKSVERIPEEKDKTSPDDVVSEEANADDSKEPAPHQNNHEPEREGSLNSNETPLQDREVEIEPSATTVVMDPVAHPPTIVTSSMKNQSAASYASELKVNDLAGTSSILPDPDDDRQLHHLEEAALKLVDSLSEVDDQNDWEVAVKGKAPRADSQPLSAPLTLNSGVPDLALKWFYKDPQGETQGPFTNQEMREWFHAGYFTLDLLVKRACDPQFTPLGDLIAKWRGIPFELKQPPQPSTSELQLLALQKQKQQLLQQQQQQQLLQQQQQQQRLLQQQQQQQQLLRSYQQQHAFTNIVQQLGKSDDFLSMSPTQQQATLAQYMQILQQQSSSSSPALNVNPQNLIPNVWESEHAIGHRISPVPMVTQQFEMLKQKALEQEQAIAKKKQELENQIRREKEEQLRREKEEQAKREEEKRRKQEEELKRKQEAAFRYAEEIRQREEAKQRQADLIREQLLKEEKERKQRERERLQEEQRRKEEEEEIARLARLEEARRKKEQEEERKKAERMKREEEERRQVEEELKRKIEEEKEKQRKQREQERLKQLQLKEEEKRQQEKKAQEEAQMKKLELQRQKDEALRKKQQDHLKNMKLPSTSNWAQQQPPQHRLSSSVAEIQKLEEEKERERQKEESRLLKQQQQLQQQQQQRAVWGASSTSASLSAASAASRPLSLLEIQMEEARRMQEKTKMQPPVQKVDTSLQTSVAWGGRKTASNGGSVWGNTPAQTTPVVWDTIGSSNKQGNTGNKGQSKQSRVKQRSGSTNAESSSVMALFKQQEQPQVDVFVEWCKQQLSQIPAAANLDISTFIAFLRDIESPYDIKDYVASYLGENKQAQDFADGFIRQRNSQHKQQGKSQRNSQPVRKLEQTKAVPKQNQLVPTGWNQPLAGGDDMEVVTGSTKRGKRKQRKLQKVDPSILGFSVNAASDRLNMGEIEKPTDI